MRVCYIVGAGDFTPRGFSPSKGDLVIAADGGYRTLLRHGLRPDLLLGDFDSLGDVPLPEDIPIERFPVRKDDTDSGIALVHGWAQGFRSFAIYGGSGGRTDHLLANLQSMCHYSRLGGQVRLAALDFDAYAVSNGTLILPKRPEGTLVSVFCNGDRAEGVTLRGLTYPLTDHTLTCDVPLGVSNQVASGAANAEVTVRKGTLLVMQAAASAAHNANL